MAAIDMAPTTIPATPAINTRAARLAAERRGCRNAFKRSRTDALNFTSQTTQR
jgi:hypothetical protein